MRLKAKILTLVIVPIVLLTIVISLVCRSEISADVKGIIQTDLQAMTLAMEDDMSLGGNMENSYYVDENGDMWNGDYLNMTEDTDLLDAIKAASGIDITIFYGDTRRVTTVIDENGQRVLGTKASDTVIQKVLQGGEEYFAENVDVQGVPYFAYYIPLYNDADSSTPVGMIFAGKAQSVVDDGITRIMAIIIGVGVVLVVVLAIIAYLITNQMVKKIHYGISVIGEVAEGNLTTSIQESELHGKDEVSDIMRAVNDLQKKLSDIVRDINDMCGSVGEATDSLNKQADLSASHISQIDTAVNEIAQGATTQAEETQETTENVIVMGDMIEKNNSQIDMLNTNAEAMNKTSESVIGTLKELESINGKTKDAIEVIYAQTNTTNESAMKIREAINLITDIAEETNLLSLNASIEAARAGEQGRGFAVVAGQIQKLAEQSNESARKIEEIVASLIDDSDKAVETMNEVRQIMEEQNSKVERTGDMFKQLKSGIDQSVTAVNVIADSTKEIDKTRISVVDSAQSLTSIAQENAASTEETSAAVSELTEIMNGIANEAKHLEEVAEGLQEEFKFFKVN